MVSLTDDPRGAELEDYIAAHFIARGAFVETGVTERDPADILELDVVWTNYKGGEVQRNPVEIKSGKWHISDLFKFYGWTQYLNLPPGQFIYREQPERFDMQPIRDRMSKLGIKIIHIDNMYDVSDHFIGLGLGEPTTTYATQIWRYSFWAQRQLLNSLQSAVRREVCSSSAKRAKSYYNLINDAIFFEPQISKRLESLLESHFEHRYLALTAANELAGRPADFTNPQKCKEFADALYYGKYLPVQACLYLSHRARLSVLKAAVDYVLDGGMESSGFLPSGVTNAIRNFAHEYGDVPSFRLFPTFWQVLLWGHGGIILADREDDEYEMLSAETGVPPEEIPSALQAFDTLFPISGGWMTQPYLGSYHVVKLMPPAIRGIGAFRSLLHYEVEDHAELGYRDNTAVHLRGAQNTTVRLLEADHAGLVE